MSLDKFRRPKLGDKIRLKDSLKKELAKDKVKEKVEVKKIKKGQ